MQESNLPGQRKALSPDQPIDTYLGRQIFLKRVVVENLDRGTWLHWSHPQDQGCPGGLKYGHFLSPDQSLETALLAVHQTIEASIELELISSNADHEVIEPQIKSSKRWSSPHSADPWLHLVS